jgi:demethoxyubiquinone hydroxylase (CLK1/Coq7/Cat5 family)
MGLMTRSSGGRNAGEGVHGNFTAVRTIARILKVNHAGEHGAIRIYRSQIAIARWRSPDVVPKLEEMLAHEVSHRARFCRSHAVTSG